MSLGAFGRGFVEDEPVEAELARGFHELIEVDGLANVAVGTQAVAIGAVLLFIGRGENDDGEKLGAFVGAELAEDLEAVELGEFEVKQNDFRERGKRRGGIGTGSEEIVESFAAIAGDDDFVLNIIFFQRAECEQLVIGIVLDEKNGFDAQWKSPSMVNFRQVSLLSSDLMYGE
jgi:hypothetical protein